MSLTIEDKINETISQALTKLDVTLLASVMSDDMVFEPFINPLKTNKEIFIKYFTDEFRRVSPTEGMRNSIEDYHGHRGVVLLDSMPHIIFDIDIAGGKVTRLTMKPYPSLTPDFFAMHFPLAADYASRQLHSYFDAPGHDGCVWLQSIPSQVRFQDFCIAYKTHVLSIVIALYQSHNPENKYYADPSLLDAMKKECTKNHLTPCLFLIDPDGRAHSEGLNLYDPDTLEPIDIDTITDDGSGIMSPWEIHCLGILHAADYLRRIGCTDIACCNVPTVDPQLFFTYNNKQSYAIVRAVPCGLADQKLFINRQILSRLSDHDGYFIDVRINSMFGGSGLFDDKQLYRGMLSVQRHEGEAPVCNLMFSEPQLRPLEDAIKENDFIELTGEYSPDITEEEILRARAHDERQVAAERYRYHRDAMLKMMNRRCGYRVFHLNANTSLASIKLSDILYCNIELHAPMNYLTVSEVTFQTLINAFGISAGEARKRMGLTQEYKPGSKFTRRFLHRTTADDTECTHIDTFASPTTGELFDEEVYGPFISAGCKIEEDLFGFYRSMKLSRPMLLYKKDIPENDLEYYNELSAERDKTPDAAMQEIRKHAPCLLPLFDYPDRERLLRSLFKACRALCPSDTMPLDNLNDIPTSNKKLSLLVTQFFDMKMKYARVHWIDHTRMWRELRKYLINNGIPEKDARQFVNSFTFLY